MFPKKKLFVFPCSYLFFLLYNFSISLSKSHVPNLSLRYYFVHVKQCINFFSINFSAAVLKIVYFDSFANSQLSLVLN